MKSVLRKCIICKRFQGKTLNPQETPDLPSFRLDFSYSFCNVGLDYAGPLYVRHSARASAEKVYILLFTCATSRAVHLELVPDMKAPSFIRAFERFVSRKGVPSMIINDNFRTFKSSSVKRYLSKQGIQQRYILPASPWWGGFYERLVRSVKLSLKKSLGRSLLTYEQLETILCKSEFVINNRPLTYVSSDDLEESLTPFYLLFERNVSYPNKRIYLDQSIPRTEEDIKRKTTYMKKLISNHWKSFQRHYVNELRQHHSYKKNSKKSQPPVIGDVVLIRDDTPLPRQRWRLGKITEHIVGRDNAIRGVKLTVSSESGNQVCYRPIQKIIPLEVTDEQNKVDEQETEQIENNVPEIVQIQEESSFRRPLRQAAREGLLRRRFGLLTD